jgi:transcriptional regulator GlxA family with amidase domain
MVEEDHGRDVALAVARALVVYLKRPGGQAQFSAQLAEQIAEREPLREVQAFVMEHPRADLSVNALARRAGMSPRNFARAFTREVGTTPARFVLRARVETARRLLEDSSKGLGAIAAASGLGSAEVVRRAFQRTLGVGPAAYRARFNPRAAAGAALERRAS